MSRLRPALAVDRLTLGVCLRFLVFFVGLAVMELCNHRGDSRATSTRENSCDQLHNVLTDDARAATVLGH